MDRSDARDNLLFGLLALRRGLIDQTTLVEAHFAWLDEGRGLDQVLLARGAIDGAAHAELSEAVARLAREAEAPGVDTTADASDTMGTIAALGVGQSTVSDATETLHLSTLGGAADAGGDRDEPRRSDCGRYRDLRHYAKGGMGDVYRALDVELGREVAVKRIRKERADDLGYQSRFCREAEITGRLEHPGVVPVYGLGQGDDDRPYYAMKLVGGIGFDQAITAFHKSWSISLVRASTSMKL